MLCQVEHRITELLLAEPRGAAGMAVSPQQNPPPHLPAAIGPTGSSHPKARLSTSLHRVRRELTDKPPQGKQAREANRGQLLEFTEQLDAHHLFFISTSHYANISSYFAFNLKYSETQIFTHPFSPDFPFMFPT